MNALRGLKLIALGGALSAVAACSTAPPPPPVMERPAVFTPLGLDATYLSGDVIGTRRARAAKLHAAGVRPIGAGADLSYVAATDVELRRQTAGMGLDVMRVGDGIVIRIPASLTFDTNSSVVKPQFDATLLEIARTVKNSRQTYVDVLAHTDTSGGAPYNQSLSDRRASAVAAFLVRHGVARARIASRGLGESAPLYAAETDETQRAANRRVEIRLVPYRASDAPATGARRRRS